MKHKKQVASQDLTEWLTHQVGLFPTISEAISAVWVGWAGKLPVHFIFNGVRISLENKS